MKFITVFTLCFFAFNAAASIKAITDAGDIVILNDDGTWKYENGAPEKKLEIQLNPQSFTKEKSANFLLKSSRTNSAFWINPKKWTFKKSDNGHQSAEYTFTIKGTDLYGMAISEQLEIDVEELAVIALNNARSVASDTKVIKKEYRMVNDHKVIYMEMEGTIQSIKFTYLGYYFSNESGSTQYLAYTGSNLVNKYQKDIDAFLNGFTIQ